MKKTIYKAGAGILAAVLCVLCLMPASAIADGVYTAPTETFYLNPDTGVTDDGGTQNAALGEGMCRSAVYKEALIETENGKTYVTIRMLLASNVKNTAFTVQKTAGDSSSYYAVNPDIMAENANSDSRDYRFEVPSATSYIGCSMYVTPMGRDVKFYLQVKVGSASAGGGDFVVSIKEASAALSEETISAAEAMQDSAQTDTSQINETASAPEVEEAPAPDSPEDIAADSEEGTETDGADAQEEARQAENEEEAAPQENAPDASEESNVPENSAAEAETGSGALAAMIAGGLIIAAAAVYVLRKKKKR